MSAIQIQKNKDLKFLHLVLMNMNTVSEELKLGVHILSSYPQDSPIPQSAKRSCGDPNLKPYVLVLFYDYYLDQARFGSLQHYVTLTFFQKRPVERRVCYWRSKRGFCDRCRDEARVWARCQHSGKLGERYIILRSAVNDEKYLISEGYRMGSPRDLQYPEETADAMSGSLK